MRDLVITPWHNPHQKDRFLQAWGVNEDHPNLLLVQDEDKSGCAKTKNRGLLRARELKADLVVILDDDCFPSVEAPTLEALISEHRVSLRNQEVEMFEAVTSPPSRGTPYSRTTIEFPVAASMGFWENIGDFCAVRQLSQLGPMQFRNKPIYGRYFPLSGMNLAFYLEQSWPWCQFIDVPRFDDIWMGWIWQKHAYANSQCFNLNGPSVVHSRQSNVWVNLRQEVENLEVNETLWVEIAKSSHLDYDSLVNLLPRKTL
jgi:hypothetical protein